MQTGQGLHNLYEPVKRKVFLESESDSCLLYPLLSAGASAMKIKLCHYAQAMLPGGRYWEPDPDVEAVLHQLRPSNDLCESILGSNDYLTTANLHQLSHSNLIQVKKKQDDTLAAATSKGATKMCFGVGNPEKSSCSKGIPVRRSCPKFTMTQENGKRQAAT